MSAYVLDSSAALALFKGEPGLEKVAAAMLLGVKLSAVNAAEIVSVLMRDGWPPADAKARVTSGAWQIVDVDAALAMRAAELSELTGRLGLSLGDRICLALAEREGCPALTADRVWTSLGVGITVELIR